MSQYLPTALQQFIHKSRYARYLDDAQRRESWDETVTRFCDFWSNTKDGASFPYADVMDAVLKLEVLPSMRLLMTAGKAAERDNIAAYNCFSEDTRLVTKSGIFSFSELGHGTEIEVLAKGRFHQATVTNFGSAPLLKLTVKKGTLIEDIYTTSNHRWITVVPNGNTHQIREVTTENLKEGDVLKKAHFGVSHKNPMTVCKVGMMHGMVFGNGTAHAGSTRITLCGDSIQFKELFTGTGKHSSPRPNRYTICNLPWNWKQLPDTNANKEYLMGFLMGWFAADGSVGKSGSNIKLSNRDYSTINWFKGTAARLGIFSRTISGGSRKNPFSPEKTCTLFNLDLFGETVPPYFFLKDSHAERFASRKTSDKFQWKVVSVEPTNRVEDVWCVQVPGTEAFTLANGIETKNCSYVAINNKRAFSETLHILLNGTGVGFSCERQEIAKLPMVPDELTPTENIIVVEDSKIGWSKAYKKFISSLYDGDVPKVDYSKLRPAGSRLKTFGGRASGPGPLKDLFNFTHETFKNAVGRKLTSVEVHDIVCKIGDVVVVGGVRRCLPEGTLVQTGPNDWKEIQNFTADDSIYLEGEYQKVLNVFDQGNQEVLKIELEDGKYLESTATHRWMCWNKEKGDYEWVMTKDLTEQHGFIS